MTEIRQSCPYGLTSEDLDLLFGDRRADFSRWMCGQTAMLCEGRSYDHEAEEYKPDACAGHPHGIVTYRWDVERYLDGLPVVD